MYQPEYKRFRIEFDGEVSYIYAPSTSEAIEAFYSTRKDLTWNPKDPKITLDEEVEYDS